MAAQYVIWISSQTGQRMRVLEDWLKLDYARSTNDVGQLVLTMPPKFNMALAPVDSRIEIWRSPTGGTPILETGTTWLVRGPLDTVIPERGDRTKVIRAASAADLLRRRIVAYAAGSAQAKKSMAADDMLKQIVAENLGSSATDTARSIAAYLTIQGNVTAAPSLAKEFAYANVLKALQDVAQASAQAGTRLYFDIVAPTPDTLEFRTYVGQRGTDHGQTSAQPVVFAIERGNLAGVVLSKDYSSEVTFVYAGGQGTGSARVTNSAEDTARSGRSVFGRREAFVSDTVTTDTTAAALLPTANAELQRGRPKKRMSATILDTPAARYGSAWGFGDKIVANVDGEIFDARVEQLQVSLSGHKEVVTARISADSDL
jgi:hypothetical protein